jgi:alkyl hydroperoxide reductase subunit F
MTYDLIILGGGPAGAGAAVYAARKKLKTLLVTETFEGQSAVSVKIHNWIGDQEIGGVELAKKLEAHVRSYESDDFVIKTGNRASSVTKENTTFKVTLSNGNTYESKSVLVATGSSRKKLTIPGAAEFENKGVVYCASCDGPLFSGQNVVVIGGGNAGFETALQLLAYCPSVTLIHRSDNFRADEMTIESAKVHPNFHLKAFTEPAEVVGEAFVTGLKVKNNQTNEEEILYASGIFVEIGQIPNSDFLGDLAEKTKHGNIVVDAKTHRSSADGLWAAGDVTDTLYHQNNIATGQAVTAIEDLYFWLKKQN